MKTVLSLSEARQIALHSQGLLSSDFPTGKEGTLSIVEQIGYVQIDTISVVERAHHHILWNRQPDYKLSYLNELIRDKSAFEYWSHAAAYLPMKDYRYSLINKKNHAQRIAARLPDNSIRNFVLDRIKAEGPLQARDFEHSGKGTGGWWEHKPAKHALELLFIQGDLMIAGRVNFQKIFDLTERVLPPDVNKKMPTEGEYSRYLINSAINAHGFASIEEISYLRGGESRKTVQKGIKQMLENGELQSVTIENNKQEYYSTVENLNSIGLPANEQTHILSPFDNAVIQRKRLRTLWDFDYQIECYVPASKRKFGYFCLPIMKGDYFIGRIDAKADRKTKRLIINTLYIEKESIVDYSSLTDSIVRFAQFNGCTTIEITATNPSTIKRPLVRELKIFLQAALHK
ncbi:MAG: YcaQ family DNA glycosylase [Bacteroidetes bacterium]|nr:YcaQ family DNA glycosylase [Bacteroidota bacterium]